jgi:hypothetical protein
MRIAGIALVVLALGITPPTTQASSHDGATALTITYFADGGDTSKRTRWTLRCVPVGGTHPRRAAACSTLARLGRDVFAPISQDVACAEIYGGPQVAIVSGRLEGRRVWARFHRDDGCQINRWSRAGELLPQGRSLS